MSSVVVFIKMIPATTVVDCGHSPRRIRGKEGMICEYEEEAEVFKERNYRQKERVKPRACTAKVSSTHVVIACSRG